ncbi:MAG: hypothetical protein WBW41_04705 [Verrucomicrobiia bacterium]
MNGSSDSIQAKKAEDWLSNFPRLFDLYQRSKKDDPQNYFNFEKLFPIAFLGSAAYADLENALAKLDAAAWEKLRKKTLSYITKDSSLRGYHQLFNGLNEARGCIYLAEQGYDQICFIEEEPPRKLPDLLAKRLGSVAILEVKSVNPSEEDINQQVIRERETIKVDPRLTEKFKTRIKRSIRDAREQLDAYPYSTDRKIVFLIIQMEFTQSTCGESYIELNNFIAGQNAGGIEVIHQARP